MRPIGNEAYLDTSGQLYITRPGIPDSFDPPGYEPPPTLQATGFTFDDVPTYGWPLSIIYKNNPLQFASQATAEKMLARMGSIFPGLTFRISLDEVTVGPYRRAAIRQIAASDVQGLLLKQNAGEMANQLARYPQSFTAAMDQAIGLARGNRDRE